MNITKDDARKVLREALDSAERIIIIRNAGNPGKYGPGAPRYTVLFCLKGDGTYDHTELVSIVMRDKYSIKDSEYKYNPNGHYFITKDSLNGVKNLLRGHAEKFELNFNDVDYVGLD